MSKLINPNKCTTNTILPQDEPLTLYGKRMFVSAPSDIAKDLQNAGVLGERLSELNLNSRKKINDVKSDSSQMKDALNYSNLEPIKIQPKKTPLTSYSGYNNQEKYFETKLMPDSTGRMSICVGRKSGSATINMNVDDYDLEKTYHTWKRIMEKDAVHTRSNLENDRFLTVCEDAKRLDRPPEVKNRNPPVANPDGPFEIERPDVPQQRRDNLDRTLTPKENSQRRDVFRKVTSNFVNTFHISQPHREEVPIPIKGVRRTRFPWLDNNRLKDIIQNSYGNSDVHSSSGSREEAGFPPRDGERRVAFKAADGAQGRQYEESTPNARPPTNQSPNNEFGAHPQERVNNQGSHSSHYQYNQNQRNEGAQYGYDQRAAEAQYGYDQRAAEAQHGYDQRAAEAQHGYDQNQRNEELQYGYDQNQRNEEAQYGYDQNQRNEEAQYGYDQNQRNEEAQYDYRNNYGQHSDQAVNPATSANDPHCRVQECCGHDHSPNTSAHYEQNHNSRESNGYPQNLHFQPPSFNDLSKY